MNYLKILCTSTIVIVIGVTFFCTNKPTEPDNRPNQITHKGLYGKLVDKDRNAILGAKVKAINATGALQKSNSASFSSATETDSVATDSSGYYSFESLSAGTYNLQGDYGNGELVVLITGISYDSAGAIKEVKTDTLRAPGQISGSVNTHTEDNGGVLCYLPGTSYLAITDDTGGFVLSNIPQGNYQLTYRKEGLKTLSDSGIEVRSSERTKLPVKDMEADPAYPPPAPAGLSATYDTLHGCAILTWNPVIVSDLAGYVVYRNDTSSSTPERLNTILVTDTFYIDTVFSDLMDTSNPVFSYRIKAQDKDANISTVYSKPFTISMTSPIKVRTFFSWKFLNTIADSASINDTVSIIVSYRNETRNNKKLTWHIGSRDSVFLTVDDSSLTGTDTIQYIWHVASKPEIYISMVDEANTVWWDSTTINIVQDIPIADAGLDTIVYIGDTVTLRGSASQQFGYITKWEWDIGNTGIFITTLKGDTNIICPSVENMNLLCILRVIDDDGNIAKDTIKISVSETLHDHTPPSISIISPKDSQIVFSNEAYLKLVVSDSNGISSVLVNGDSANYSGQNSYEYLLKLVEGINTITITAKDNSINLNVDSINLPVFSKTKDISFKVYPNGEWLKTGIQLKPGVRVDITASDTITVINSYYPTMNSTGASFGPAGSAGTAFQNRANVTGFLWNDPDTANCNIRINEEVQYTYALVAKSADSLGAGVQRQYFLIGNGINYQPIISDFLYIGINTWTGKCPMMFSSIPDSCSGYFSVKISLY